MSEKESKKTVLTEKQKRAAEKAAELKELNEAFEKMDEDLAKTEKSLRQAREQMNEGIIKD